MGSAPSSGYVKIEQRGRRHLWDAECMLPGCSWAERQRTLPVIEAVVNEHARVAHGEARPASTGQTAPDAFEQPVAARPPHARPDDPLAQSHQLHPENGRRPSPPDPELVDDPCRICGAGAYWRLDGHAAWCDEVRAANAASAIRTYGPDDRCAEPDCDEPPHARGLCRRHYQISWRADRAGAR